MTKQHTAAGFLDQVNQAESLKRDLDEALGSLPSGHQLYPLLQQASQFIGQSTVPPSPSSLQEAGDHVFSHLVDPIIIYTPEGCITAMNTAAEIMFQVSRHAAAAHYLTDLLRSESELLLAFEQSLSQDKADEEYRCALPIKTGSGSWVRPSFYLYRAAPFQPQRLAILEDVTEIVALQNAIVDNERYVRGVVNSVPDLIYKVESDHPGKLFLNEAARAFFGDESARDVSAARMWGSYIHQDDRCRVYYALAQALVSAETQFTLSYRVIDPNSGQTRFVDDHGYIQRDEKGVARFITGVIRDVTERVELQQDNQTKRQQLKQSLIDTIESLGSALEKRDPYTAGHQRRVAEIAVGIGERLGLQPDRLEGLRLGAVIHDVGKIYVPFDILNRPGRLSEVEFNLVKTHSQVGYDILKNVQFPWPVAEMVLQHHERLDGGGYPYGLEGDQIILEARILAVADVVEAITAHRPYRAGLGIEVALAEIRRGRGKQYDGDVVDACIELIRHQHGDMSL